MSEYTRYDFSETMRALGGDVAPVKVLRAWGVCGDYAEWSGGFVLLLQDGRYAYVSGWCDTTGWGCQDGVDVEYSDTLEGLGLPVYEDWDEEPADLNRWLTSGGTYDD